MSAPTPTRRNFLRSGTIAVASATTVGAVAGSASAGSDYDGYLSDVGNYDGTVVDETGAGQITIRVGAQGNDGPNAFDPPAVQVSPGTTIVWEWVEGFHNVVDEDGSFESEMSGEAGFTFEQTFEESGVVTYYCNPHRGIGMKGVVDVVEGGQGGGGGGSGGEGGDGGGDGGSGTGDGSGGGTLGGTGGGVGPVIPSVLALAFVLPAAFAALRGRDSDDQE